MEKIFFEKPTTFVGEVTINVTNLDKALTFYQTIIGFKILKQTDSKAVLTADGITPLLTLIQPDDVIAKEGKTTGLFHFAILLPTRADLSAFLKHIIQTGTQLGASDHYVSEALYLSDPDGNGIEVYRDRPSSEWDWSDDQVAMATEQLDGEGLLAESNQEWNGLPSDTVMGHIHLHVADLEKTEEFYTKGLGFKVVTKYPGALFTSTGNYHHHIGLNVWNGVGAPPPKKNSAGLNWFTLIYPDEDARAKVVAQLGQLGASVVNEQDSMVVDDPSGNSIHLNVGE
ncbi:VOC family protein [Virgibacillus sp. C22-A2]|uniref:VOC family protein n=1 Tax=Virgibacillus tibetensis TaxID=3042313 RepID=A0ABU6KK42_9BACI|nr:VOC family protein [Virgibacillus sp. C22-A2]